MSGGLSMGFGPAPKPQRSSEQLPADQPSSLVLSVLQGSGSFPVWKTIAAGLDRGDLEQFLSQWILNNSQTYAGQFKLETVPFLIPRKK